MLTLLRNLQFDDAIAYLKSLLKLLHLDEAGSVEFPPKLRLQMKQDLNETIKQIQDLRDAQKKLRQKSEAPNAGGAANAVKLPQKPGQLQHIFRNAPGHLPDTPANRALLEGLSNDAGAVLGTDKFGNTWAARLNADGTQTWVQYRCDVIINGGLNPTPRTFNPQTGLSGP
ncbi:MAG: hypothetical protein JSS02_35585 [Planctomycetes bacterium]|nr:hypothetical protein [Planctomycetota bacterium]